MITVDEALNIVDNKTISSKKSTYLSVQDALGYVLSQDVLSPINMPPFRQSAMDGYAICIHESKKYNLIGEIKAGDRKQMTLSRGEAFRIFTGAPVPDTANAVIMQEKVINNGTEIELQAVPNIGSNIRPLGEQIKEGELALQEGSLINSAAIGFLSSLGITEVNVYKKPSIGILVTGNELIEPGHSLDYGQVYESNSLMLQNALHKTGYKNTETYKVPDDFRSTLLLINQIINDKDFLIISGGISVGDYDYVGKALLEIKATQLFYKVKQKPGKPLFFGRKDNTCIFALPGNPAAALTCFYVYVWRCLERLSGNNNFKPVTIEAVSVSEINTKGDRFQFLKAKFLNGKVEILEGQSSAMLNTFAVANALAYAPVNLDKIEIGQKVKCLLIP